MKKNYLIIGYIIYLVGVVSGSCFAVHNPPIWTPFGISIAAIILGSILIRIAYKVEKPKKDENTEEVKEDKGIFQKYLTEIVETSKKIFENAEKENYDRNKTKDDIDSLLTNAINEFVNRKQFMINILGMKYFGEIFIPFSYGERMLNRAWSAFTDDVKEEGMSSLGESIEAFEETLLIIKRITRKKGTGELI